MSKPSVLSPTPITDALACLEDKGEEDLAGATALFGARGDNLDRLLTVQLVRDEGLARAAREGIITYSKKGSSHAALTPLEGRGFGCLQSWGSSGTTG